MNKPEDVSGDNKFYVYMIKNLLNNKVYIGKSKNPKKRWLKHVSKAKIGGEDSYAIHEAIAKYGKENFELSIIEELKTEDESLDREIFWIEFHKSNIKKYGKEFGYNLSAGGEEGHSHEFSRDELLIKSANTKKQLANKPTSKTRKAQVERIEKINSFQDTLDKIEPSDRNKRHFTEEHRSKLSAAHTGKTLSEEHRRKIALNNKNKKHTEKSKLKLAIAKLGSKNPNSKLTEDKVREIKHLLVETDLLPSEIGEKFGVAARTIRDIANGLSWIHVKI